MNISVSEDLAGLGPIPSDERDAGEELMKIYKKDLHRLKHEDVQQEVIRFIEEHWNEEAELEIITGNSQRMQGIVMNVLDEYKMTYQISRLFDINNKGYLVTWTG